VAAAALTILSYNIRKALGNDRRRAPERILDVLDEAGADIAILQEADLRFGQRAAALPPALLHARGWAAVPLDTGRHSIGWHGNAILLRSRRAGLIRSDILPLPVLEPRGAILADVETGRGPLRLVGMHLDISGLLRRRQALAILEHLQRQPSPAMPTVLMGDLNEWRPLAGAILDLSSAYRLVETGPSYHARMPLGRLDRIFVSERMEVAGAGVHRSPLASVASDHLPVWLRLGGHSAR
jgi:endonuclease/exonuclease/phosphatase family metal-dependent hydrolase